MSSYSLDVGTGPADVPSNPEREYPPAFDSWPKIAREWKRALEATYPAPAGCSFRVASNPHDFGAYPSVVADGDETAEGFDAAAWEAWALAAENRSGAEGWPEGFGPARTPDVLLWVCADCGVERWDVADDDAPYNPARTQVEFRHLPRGADEPDDETMTADELSESRDGDTLPDGAVVCSNCVTTCDECGDYARREGCFVTNYGGAYVGEYLCSEDCLSAYEWKQKEEAMPDIVAELFRDGCKEACIDEDAAEDLFDALYRSARTPKLNDVDTSTSAAAWRDYVAGELETEANGENVTNEDKRTLGDFFPLPPLSDYRYEPNPDETNPDAWSAFFRAADVARTSAHCLPFTFSADVARAIASATIGDEDRAADVVESAREGYARFRAHEATADLPFAQQGGAR